MQECSGKNFERGAGGLMGLAATLGVSLHPLCLGVGVKGLEKKVRAKCLIFFKILILSFVPPVIINPYTSSFLEDLVGLRA